MKYEFHVGDYVETKDGDTGFITEIDTDEDSFWYGSSYWYCTSSRGPRHEKRTYIIPDGTDADMARIFNRIGQYDFTEKNDNKIEPLIVKQYNDYCNNKLMWDKINELIDAVNQLREKV